MKRDIYVAFDKGDGTGVGWLLNPEPFYDEDFCVLFTTIGLMAGVAVDSFGERGIDSNMFIPAVQDKLDKFGIPWSELRNGRFVVRSLCGTTCEVFLMKFKLTGPLPCEVAERLDGPVVEKPVKVMLRYGG